jgi:leader peptidase (prepilin peptidase)/N-methyltransferase
VELLTSLLFVAAWRQFGWTWELLSALLLICFLLPLAFIDLDTWLLPHEITWPGIAVGVLAAIPLGLDRVRDSAIGAAAAFLGFWLMEWLGKLIFRKEALGGGDKDLLALIGAFLTYKPLLGVVFLASLQGSIVGLLLLAIRGRAGPAPDATSDEGEKKPGEGTGSAGASTGSARTGGEGTGSAGASTSSARTGEDEWVPGPTNMPFGPWLAVAALEVLLLGPWLSARFGWEAALLFGGR